MNIPLTIEKLGLKESQANVYLTLLQMGSGRIQTISQKANVKRTTAYSILDVLIQKGLVSMIKKNRHREYFAENPQKLPRIFDQEIDKMERIQKNLASAVPELASFYNLNAVKPKIRFYEGIEGIKKVLAETLNLEKDEEVLAYSSTESAYKYLSKEYVDDYIAKRVQKKIRQRDIARYSPEALEHANQDKKELRETRLVDADKFPLSNEINIFSNKICILSFKDLLGIVIESTEIAKTQKAIFELAWLGAEKIKK